MKSSIATGMMVGFGLVTSAFAQTDVRDVDHPARHAFARSLSATINAGQTQSNFPGFDVPDGQVLVIEFISTNCVLDSEDSIFFVRINLEFPSTDPIIPTIEHFVPVARQGNARGTTQLWVGAQNVRLYARNSQLGFINTVIMDFARTNTTTVASCSFSFSGYTVQAAP
jgi:hypothetical protein